MMTKEMLIGLITAIATLVVIAVLDREEALSKVPYDCVDPTERERVRELALKGIDDGFVQAAAHLYTIWQKDPDTDQPKRAQVGMTNAVNAHVRARKFAVVWDPPNCKQP